jgi:hypothetical protein
MDRPKIVFIHVQKTGGTSLRRALSKHFPAEEICEEHHDKLREWAPEELNRYRLFAGHFSFSSLTHIRGPKIIIMLLREPRARLLSYFNFVKRHRRAYLAEKDPNLCLVKDMTLSQFLQSGAPYHQRIIDQIGDGSLLRSIIRFLKIDVICFAENMPRAQRMIWQRLGLPPQTKPLPRTNVTCSLQGTNYFEDEPFVETPLSACDKRLLNKLTRGERFLYAIAALQVAFLGPLRTSRGAMRSLEGTFAWLSCKPGSQPPQLAQQGTLTLAHYILARPRLTLRFPALGSWAQKINMKATSRRRGAEREA